MSRLAAFLCLFVTLFPSRTLAARAQVPDPVKELWDSTKLGGNCYSYGKDAGRTDGQCAAGESMLMRGAVAPGIPVHDAHVDWPGCKPTGQRPRNPNENDVMGILEFLGLKNPPTAVAECVTPSVPFPTNKTITRIDLSMIVNGKSAGTCGPVFYVGSDNKVISPKEGPFHKCSAMFTKDINTPFDNSAFSTPIIANGQVSAVFANWAGDTRVGMIRVYYK